MSAAQATMAHSPRYEAHREAAWLDLIATADALCPELKAAPPQARQKTLAAVARALREAPGRGVWDCCRGCP